MLTSPRRRFRLRLKTSVSAFLLISVFISSGFLVQSAHAQIGYPVLDFYPNAGSCNPFANTLANSERFLYQSGYDDLSGSPQTSDDGQGSITHGSGQLVREAAIYANGNEPMAVAWAHASLTSEDPIYDYSQGYPVVAGQIGQVNGVANAVLLDWSYLIFNKATGKPLDSSKYYSTIPVDLNYTFSMTATGNALAQGEVTCQNGQNAALNPAVMYAEGTGQYANESGGSPEGTLSFTYSGYGGLFSMTIQATATVLSEVWMSQGQSIYNWPLSEAQAVVDPYLYIDPSSSLAGQLQVYVGKTANANQNDPSQWTPSVQTSINLNNIVPLATSFANSTAYPSSSSTPTVSTSPIVPEFSSQLLGITFVVSMLIILPAVIIAKKKRTHGCSENGLKSK